MRYVGIENAFLNLLQDVTSAVDTPALHPEMEELLDDDPSWDEVEPTNEELDAMSAFDRILQPSAPEPMYRAS